jgi:AMP-binding enzyme
MVEEPALSKPDALSRKHPIAAFTLDALTVGAAKLRPDRIALAEAGPGASDAPLTYAELERQVRALAQHFAELRLAPDERILLLTGARTACVAAMIGVLAAGIEPVLARIGFGPAALAKVAAAANCAVIAGPTSYGEIRVEDILFETAARSEMLRLVATLGPGTADGAIDFNPATLRSDDPRPSVPDKRARIGTLNFQGEPVFHEQSALLAAALDLVGNAEIVVGSHLVSTLAPASFASLVAGPVASLLSGAPLTLFGPFQAAAFLALVDDIGANHCVVPGEILPTLERAGLLDDTAMSSVIAISRDDTALPPLPCRLVQVHALEEGALRAERRIRANSKSPPILSGEVLAPVPPVWAERSSR